MTTRGLDPWQEAMKQAREIVWGPDAIFIVACLLMAKEADYVR